MQITSAIRRAAQINGRGVAILDGKLRHSWSEVSDRIARLAGGLTAAGVAPGDRVALLAPNTGAVLELHYAALWAGAVLVPINFRLASNELAQVLQAAEPKLLFVTPALASAHQRALVGCTARVVALDTAEHRALYDSHASADLSSLAPDGLAALCFTGGTTGVPKGVMIRHDSVVVQALEMTRMLETSSATVALHVMPLFHLAGSGVAHGVTLGAGAHSVMAQFDVTACIDRIAEHRITHLSLVPSMVSSLLGHATEVERVDVLRRLRMLSYGAAPMPSSLLETAVRELPNTRFRQFYGMTELSGACVTLAPEDHGPEQGTRRTRSAGRVVPSMEIDVRAANGFSCPPGEPGEIVARGPLAMSGYWRDPDATASAFLPGGWLRTGDIGTLDECGYLTLLDRSKDVIITGGENIFSAEVEAALIAHRDVVDCAVIGVPDEHWGERVHGIIVLADATPIDRLPETLLAHCRERLAGYKCPRSWSFRFTSLPLSAMGKVQKYMLRKEILVELAR